MQASFREARLSETEFQGISALGSSVNKGTKGAGTSSSPGPSSSGGGGSRTRVRERAVREILRA